MARQRLEQSIEELNGQVVQLYGQGRYREALERARQVCELARRVKGTDHPKTADSLNNLGLVLYELGDLAAARAFFQEALEICRHVLGEDHPQTALSLDNLAFVFEALGEMAAARPYREQALDIRRHVLGNDHPDTATSISRLGSLLHALGDPAAALPYHEQALEIRRRVLGTSASFTAVEPARLDWSLEGLRTLARFTDQIWPVPAERAQRGISRGDLRGLGAPQEEVAHGYRLGSRVRLNIEAEREGSLLLLDEGPEGVLYCLCPSHFAPDVFLPRGRSTLPQERSRYDSFVLTGKPGREQLLAIITERPLGLDWLPATARVPARVLSGEDVKQLLARLKDLEPGRWTPWPPSSTSRREGTGADIALRKRRETDRGSSATAPLDGSACVAESQGPNIHDLPRSGTRSLAAPKPEIPAPSLSDPAGHCSPSPAVDWFGIPLTFLLWTWA